MRKSINMSIHDDGRSLPPGDRGAIAGWLGRLSTAIKRGDSPETAKCLRELTIRGVDMRFAGQGRSD